MLYVTERVGDPCRQRARPLAAQPECAPLAPAGFRRFRRPDGLPPRFKGAAGHWGDLTLEEQGELPPPREGNTRAARSLLPGVFGEKGPHHRPRPPSRRPDLPPPGA